jgi:hypothetical protein
MSTKQRTIVLLVLVLSLVISGCGPKPTDTNVQKLKAGMTLQEVEALIGPGTRYSDLDLAKVNLGFSVSDPAYQQNTYVWLRPADNSAVVVLFEDGKMRQSMVVSSPKQ